MTRLTAADLQRLDREARGLAAAGKGSRSYLAEALVCVQESGDPLDALELLRALWRAGRTEQRAAIDGVGQCLVRSLQRAPAIAAADLARELGWLRRLVQYHENAAKDGEDATRHRPTPARQGHAAPGRPGSGRLTRQPDRQPGKSTGDPGFAQILSSLRQRRAHALAEQERARARAARADQGSPAPDRTPDHGRAAPERLPDLLAVDFADIRAVRDARKAARQRKKQGKPPRDRLLALRPMDPAYTSLAANLTCSLLRTQGLDAVLAAMDAAGGVSRPFFADTTTLDPGAGRLIQRVFLDQATAGEVQETREPT